jgi:fructokinase
MRNVYCIGETVWDIIFRDGHPVTDRPGGSMLNAAVSLGRAGHHVTFISEIGSDRPGEMILRFLEENGVNTLFVDRIAGTRTTLALAFLDAGGDAEYSFYRDPCATAPVRLPEPGKEDIVLFGSFYSLTGESREKAAALVQKAIQGGAMVVYDPNFRKPHLPDLEGLLPVIRRNIGQSDIVRGSNKDFAALFGSRNATEAFRQVSGAGCAILVYTENKSGASVATGKLSVSCPAVPVEVKSTIGAGDAFNAGIIHALIRSGIGREDLGRLDMSQWECILESGARFAADVCAGFDNYISLNTGGSVKIC